MEALGILTGLGGITIVFAKLDCPDWVVLTCGYIFLLFGIYLMLKEGLSKLPK